MFDLLEASTSLSPLREDSRRVKDTEQHSFLKNIRTENSDETVPSFTEFKIWAWAASLSGVFASIRRFMLSTP